MDQKNPREELDKQIQRNYEDLKKHFQMNQFKEMAKLLGKFTVIITPEGKRLRGKCSLTKFWRSLKKKEGPETEIKFGFDNKENEPVHVYFREIEEKDRMKVKGDEKTITHRAHVITEFHIISKNTGGTATNSTGSYVQNLPHRDGCTWEP
jgi:hypothetical protein